MKISIVTISFNQVKYLKECVDSILSQNYKNFEYVIVDPGSTDGSREYLETISDSRLIKVFKKDIGPSDGLNNGLSLCSGDIFYYLNSDDVVNEGAFQYVVSKFESLNVDILLGAANLIDAAGNLKRVLYPSKAWSLDLYLRGGALAIQQSSFFRMDLIRKNNIRFNVSNFSNWDSEFLVDLTIVDAKVYSERVVLASFRIYPESITGSKRNLEGYVKNTIKIRNKIIYSYYKRKKIKNLMRYYFFGIIISHLRICRLKI